jgi:hypothetical protein
MAARLDSTFCQATAAQRRINIWPGIGPSLYPISALIEARFMSVDTLHATLGITFTFIWLIVGQILVASR